VLQFCFTVKNTAENRALAEHGGVDMLVFHPGGVKTILNCRVGLAWSPGFNQLV